MDDVGALWTDANNESISTQISKLTSDPEGPSLSSLCGRRSLIDIYFALAQAKIFFKLDIMASIVKTELWRGGTEEIMNHLNGFDAPYALELGYNTKAFVTRDNVIHRFMRSLSAALTICDSVCPENLVHYVAKHLAGITALYVRSTFTLFLILPASLTALNPQRHLCFKKRKIWNSSSYKINPRRHG